MGIDATANIGYGFKISGSLAEDIGTDKIRIKKNFDCIFNGDDENIDICICIKKSCKLVFHYDRLIKPLNVPVLTEPDQQLKECWDQQLKEYATVLGVKNPKIGWWLCSSLG